jgi:hypothetical protein
MGRVYRQQKREYNIGEMMTEKRFEWDYHDENIRDNLTGKTYNEDNYNLLVTRLNHLEEENKELKRENDILIKQRLGEERLKQEIADYHTSNGKLHRLNNDLIRRLNEFNINYSDILEEY